MQLVDGTKGRGRGRVKRKKLDNESIDFERQCQMNQRYYTTRRITALAWHYVWSYGM